MQKFTKEGIRIGTIVGWKNAAGTIKQILPHGFESFQIHFGSEATVADLKRISGEVKDALGDTGVIISCLGAYGNPLEKEPGDVAVNKLIELLIDNAKLFDTDMVCGFAGRLRNKPVDESMKRYKEVFTPLSKRAEDKGVRIAFENCDMGGIWKTGDYNIAMTPVAWEMMFNEVPSDSIGLQWEPCHQMVKLIDPIPQLRKYAKKVFNLHGKDATVCWDVIKETGIIGPKQFAFHRTPGFGDSNWSDIITILRQNDYKGTIDIEGWHDPVYNKDLEMTGQVHGLNYLKNCRGGMFVDNPK